MSNENKKHEHEVRQKLNQKVKFLHKNLEIFNLEELEEINKLVTALNKQVVTRMVSE
jgi:polyhydroxyalkanoate synthesis regulator phasin